MTASETTYLVSRVEIVCGQCLGRLVLPPLWDRRQVSLLACLSSQSQSKVIGQKTVPSVGKRPRNDITRTR